MKMRLCRNLVAKMIFFECKCLHHDFSKQLLPSCFAAQFDDVEIFATLKYLSESGKLPFNSANVHEECDCLPNCLSISYGADVLTTRDMDLSILKFGTTKPPRSGER